MIVNHGLTFVGKDNELIHFVGYENPLSPEEIRAAVKEVREEFNDIGIVTYRRSTSDEIEFAREIVEYGEIEDAIVHPVPEAVDILLGEKKVADKSKQKTSNLPAVMLGLIAGWLATRSKDKARYDRWGQKIDKHYKSRFISHPRDF